MRLLSTTIVCLLALMLGQARAASVPVAAVENTASPLFLDGFFPIGVWVPPPYDYEKWKNRGVNTMVGIGFDLEGSIAEAHRLNLHMIREPRADPADDAGETLLLAWAQPDEPDGIYSQIPYTEIQAQYQAWKSVAPTRTVFINFIGALNQYDLHTGESGDAWYRKYALGGDWISVDRYPVNSGDANDLAMLGEMMDHLKLIAGDKPRFAFIETSNFDTTDGGRAPTPDELRAEMWEVIIHGARGLWFFPEQIAPSFEWDTTPTDVVAELTHQNALITSLASVLQGAIDPSDIGASAATPIELGWRSDASGRYIFALNLSPVARSNRAITLTRIDASSASVFGESRSVPIVAGVLSDDFAPYAVHIYVVAAGDLIFANGFD